MAQLLAPLEKQQKIIGIKLIFTEVTHASWPCQNFKMKWLIVQVYIGSEEENS